MAKTKKAKDAKKTESLRITVPPFPIYPTVEQSRLIETTSAHLKDCERWAISWIDHNYGLWKVRTDAALQNAGLERVFRTVCLQDCGVVEPEKHRLLSGVHLQTDLFLRWTAWRSTFEAIEPVLDGKRVRYPVTMERDAIERAVGGYDSFISLRAKGDSDAFPPKMPSDDFFTVISGGMGSFTRKGDHIVIAPQAFGKDGMSFRIPKEYCLPIIAGAEKLKKFTISRRPSNLREQGTYFMSIVYERTRPETLSATDANTVFVYPHASEVGVVWNEGAKMTTFLRPDVHFKPHVDDLSVHMKHYTEGSRAWRKCQNAKRKKYRVMSTQGKDDRRDVVHHLLSLGVHFVVPEFVIRSKKGKLADKNNNKRAGAPHGANWSVQNTGSIGEFVRWLEWKAKEKGGLVVRHPLTPSYDPSETLGADEMIACAEALKESYSKTTY